MFPPWQPRLSSQAISSTSSHLVVHFGEHRPARGFQFFDSSRVPEHKAVVPNLREAASIATLIRLTRSWTPCQRFRLPCMTTTIEIVTLTADQLQTLIEEAVSKAVERVLLTTVHKPGTAIPQQEQPRVWPERMTRRLAAEYLGVAEGSLSTDVSRRRWRVPFVRFGRRVLYEKSALDQWVADRRRESQ